MANGTNTYIFPVNAGDNITLRIGTTNFYASLSLYGPSGLLVKSGNDIGYLDLALVYQATNSGTFTVLVSSYSGGGSGTYQLHLAQVPGAFVVPAGDDGGPLTNGGNHNGAITRGDLDLWTFTANAGDNITLRIGTTNFYASLSLYGPGGLLVKSGNDSGYQDLALVYQATNNGTFTVLVSSYYYGGAGTYQLHLAQVPGAFVVPAGDDGGSLTNGGNHNGAIAPGDLDLWTLAANAGDNIILRIGTTNFYASLSVYGPDGTLIKSGNDAGYYDFAIAYQATNSGTFTILVSSYYYGGTGTYALHLAQVPGAFVVPAGDEGGPVTNDENYNAVISRGDLDLWTFALNAGDNIILRIGTTNFYASLRLYGPDGALLKSVDDSGLTHNLNLAYQATDGGTFTVMVSSYYYGGIGNYSLNPWAGRSPQIINGPASQTVSVGANVTLSVIATGTQLLSYQWQKNGVNISGATTATLTLTNVQSVNVGIYNVVVSNIAGSVTSAGATLVVGSLADWDILYGADLTSGNSKLLRISPQTGIGTVIGNTGFSDVFDIALTPDGRLFGVAGNQLLSIDPNTGQASSVGNLSGVSALNALTSDSSGQLLGATSGAGTLVRINPATASVTVVGNFGSGLVSSGDLAFAPDGTLYGVATANPSDLLLTVNPQTGAATVVGQIGFQQVYGIAFDSVGTLYGIANGAGTATLLIINPVNGLGYAIGPISNASGLSGLTFLARPGNYSPSITFGPQSVAIQADNSATFNVAAVGTPPLSYQWWFNGQNIAGATNATLTMSSVTAANSGGYSVVVWNAYGSVMSSPASLAVLSTGANGNRPVQISASGLVVKEPGKDNLVIVTHGWLKNLPFPLPHDPPVLPSWVTNMATAIQSKISSDWEIVAIDWALDAWTVTPDEALVKARNWGVFLGRELAGQGWKQIHFIGHSAGSMLIDCAAAELKAVPSSPVVQTTFLDPYTGMHRDERSVYGENSTWSDNYFVVDFESDVLPVGFDVFLWQWGVIYFPDTTSGPLDFAFNVDVAGTLYDATQLPVIGGVAGSTPMIKISPSHGTPIDFYLSTVNGTEPSCALGYGFPLSIEAGGTGSWPTDTPNDPPLPLCGTFSVSQNPKPVRSDSSLNFSLLPSGMSGSGVSLFGSRGAGLSSPSALLPQAAGIHPLDSGNYTNTPAWLALGLTITNIINFVQFDGRFTDTNSAEGLLTVYWNTNQIGTVDERVASTNIQTCRFALPGTVTGGLYTLSFQLDSFNGTSSSITVTNVATGFVGVTQPITLDISLTNGTPLLHLTAASNYNYLVQSSTNLVDWTPMALLVNTNGTVSFTDPAVTNSGARFYRALMP